MASHINLPASTPRKEQSFNIRSPPLNVSRASPHKQGIAARGALKKTPQRDEASVRRQFHYLELDLADEAAKEAEIEAQAAVDEANIAVGYHGYR